MTQFIYLTIIAILVIVAMTVLYFSMAAKINRCLRLLEKRFGKSDSRNVKEYECRENECYVVPELQECPVVEEYNDLISKFLQLMQERSLYLDPDLKVGYVADLLCVSQRDLSNAINMVYGISFTRMVNRERIKTAVRLYSENQNIDMVSLAKASGFKSRGTFYSSFAREMGDTPAVWCKNYKKQKQVR